ncbi:MAG TPA: preprotein translocase subunit SecA [Candidatus Kapabacteria bacterium]|jgi:preprotein translocase subunit SecA|nr:preprotein translocase subunit SecA [Candidatus Kapabacteria bacterium]HOV92846.1 preprotein translocase subunit SecA [Candidatus Kapabacteria bacterium]
MLDFLKKILPNKKEKDIQKLIPIVEEINRYYEQLDSLSDEELKNKTPEFKQKIRDAVADLEEDKGQLLTRLRESDLSSDEIIELNDQIKKIDKEIFERVEEILEEILPEAFAVVKQACKRLVEQQYHFEYTGHSAIWDMIPYDVQLMGAVALHQGNIAEMATGEGKTLVAVMPLYLNALAGKGVHLVTVNDYLARRDSEWMKPVYDFLGVTVGSLQTNMDTEERKRIYNLDIVYGTNSEFGFDYLRDNMVVEMDQIVQRPHWYAIVDEVDNVLIDEARTPLIISGPVGSQDQKFDEMNPRVKRLVDAQISLINQITMQAERLLASDKKEDREQAGILLVRAYHGLPKHNRLRKLLQEGDNLKFMQETELFYMREQNKRMGEINDELYYVVDEKSHQIDITDKGRAMLVTGDEDPDMYVIPDIAAELSKIEGDTTLTPAEKQRKIDEVHLLFAERSDKIHTISQLLMAYSLYEKDVDYVVQDGKVQIVDEFTGRILEGRRYSEGLHQAIEAKEHVKVERDTQTLATITLQNYFRLYKKLAGMTGTAETEAAEFQKIYNLDVIVIPTNKPIIREDRDDLIYRTKREKYNAIIEEIKKIIGEGRAVLVGTTSVEVSEIISKMLTRQKIKHSVLNAKNHEREAEIIRNAGTKGTVTIATNMAGRGTDIKLDEDVKKNGGLAIIGSERHEARRIDRQLRGRAGRQGDPGTTQFFISLEDNLMRLFAAERIAKLMNSFKMPEGEPIQHPLITKTVENAQKKVEENNFSIRKHLLEYDDVMNQQREVIYTRRRAALRGDRLKGELFEYIEELAEEWYEEFHPNHDLQGLKNKIRSVLLCEIHLKEEDFTEMKMEDCVKIILNSAEDFYNRKEQMLGKEYMMQLEKYAVLQTIDDKWKEHLRVMDEIKEGIYLRSYGQKDPLLEYKQEAFRQFVELIHDINLEAVSVAFKFFPQIVQVQEAEVARAQSRRARNVPAVRSNNLSGQGMKYGRDEAVLNLVTASANAPQAEEQEGARAVAVETYKRDHAKIGRNDLCPCGSGKKYKNCHGKNLN